mgnify:CR=1 FL=1
MIAMLLGVFAITPLTAWAKTVAPFYETSW